MKLNYLSLVLVLSMVLTSCLTGEDSDSGDESLNNGTSSTLSSSSGSESGTFIKDVVSCDQNVNDYHSCMEFTTEVYDDMIENSNTSCPGVISDGCPEGETLFCEAIVSEGIEGDMFLYGDNGLIIEASGGCDLLGDSEES